MMATYARWAHLGLAWIFSGGVLIQGYLAGAAMAQLGGSGDFAAHISVGYSLMGLLALAVLVSALIGRVPRGQVGLSLVLFVLYIVQTILPTARTSNPALAALHPANAMLLLVLAGVIGWRARRIVGRGPAS